MNEYISKLLRSGMTPQEIYDAALKLQIKAARVEAIDASIKYLTLLFPNIKRKELQPMLEEAFLQWEKCLQS